MSYPQQPGNWQQQPQGQASAYQGAQGQAAQPGYPQQAAYGQQGHTPGYPQPGYGAAAPAVVRPNPFAGVPVSDWARDGAAATLLLVSLALPWSFAVFAEGDHGFTIAATRVEVLLITLLSVLSIAVGYLAKFGVFGQGMPAQNTAIIRALVNVPYLLLVVLYVVFDAIQAGDYAGEVGGGLGPAVGIGLAGVLIAASPRKHEVFSAGFSQNAAKFSFNFVLVYFVVVALTTVLGVIMSILLFSDSFSGSPATFVIGYFLSHLIPALVVPALFFIVVRRSGAWRVLALGIGYVALFALFIRAFSFKSDSAAVQSAVVETVHFSFGYPLLWLGASVGLLASPALAYAMRQPQQQMELWHRSTKLAPIVIVVVGGLLAVTSILQIIASEGEGIGLAIGILICAVLSIAAALVLRMQIVSNYQQGRIVIAGIASGIAILGLIATILQGVDDSMFAMMNLNYAWIMVGYFGAMGALLYVLFTPKEVRAYFSSLQPQMPAQQAQYDTGAYQTSQFAGMQQGQQMPQPPMPQPPLPQVQPAPQPAAAPQVDPDLARRAMDPQTSPQEQHELSQRRELWPYLAQNPALYGELAQWLAQTGDPQVVAILNSRTNGA